MKNHTQDEQKILHICEAGRLAILSEEVRRFEEGMTPMSNLYREIIYQRYRDYATDLFRNKNWEDMYALYDRLYRENEQAHANDYMAHI